MIRTARKRARVAGIEHTITRDDIYWATICPVLGIELDYTGGLGQNGRVKPNTATLDRWDNDKGYIPGNVRVVSFRANTLKNNATFAELYAVAQYARYGVAPAGLEDIW